MPSVPHLPLFADFFRLSIDFIVRLTLTLFLSFTHTSFGVHNMFWSTAISRAAALCFTQEAAGQTEPDN